MSKYRVFVDGANKGFNYLVKKRGRIFELRTCIDYSEEYSALIETHPDFMSAFERAIWLSRRP